MGWGTTHILVVIGVFSLFSAAATIFKFHLYPLLIEKGLSTKEVAGIIEILGSSQVAGWVFMWVDGDKFTINNLGVITASMLPIVFIASTLLTQKRSTNSMPDEACC